MRVLSDERGFTTMELLVAATIFIVVLGATLAPLDGLWRTTKTNEQQNASQEIARQAIDRFATDIRSIGGQTQLIEKTGTADIVFKTTDPYVNPSGSNYDSIKRVRYCLSGTTLYRQEQTWTGATPALPPTNACPEPSTWSTTGTVVAANIVNGATTSIFTYDNGVTANIKTVTIDLMADTTPNASPKTTELKTAVTLRNNDLAPVASFFGLATGNLHVDLDGSAAYDPEGTPLTYRWCLTSGCSLGAAIGTASTLDYIAPSSGSRTFYFDIWDAGGIMTEASQSVNVQ
jgi:type II secretory pathway component PulJ